MTRVGDILLCAGCLATEVRMVSMSTSRLLEPYRVLAGVQLNEMPDKLCWECAEYVKKFIIFRRKCKTSHSLLQEVFMQQNEKTPIINVLKSKRKLHRLCSPYSVFTTEIITIDPRKSLEQEKQQIPTSHLERNKEICSLRNEISKAFSTENVEKRKKYVNEHGSLVKVEMDVKDEDFCENDKDEDIYENDKDEDLNEDVINKDFYNDVKDEDFCENVEDKDFNEDVIDKDFYDGVKNEDFCQDVKDEYFHQDVKEEDSCEDFKSETNVAELSGSTFINISPTISDTTRKMRRAKKTKVARKILKSRPNGLRNSKKIEAIDFGMIEESLTQEQQHEVIRERCRAEGYSTAQFQCSLCRRPFNNGQTYNNHMLVHDPVSGELECDVCHCRYKTRRQLGTHIAKCHLKRYTCSTCSKVFYDRSKAQMHHSWHKGRIYTCEKCGATFERHTTYLGHLRKKHSSEHVCVDCAQTFVSDKGLKQHYKLVHCRKTSKAASSIAGPYCETCSVQFPCQQAWKRHLRVSPKHAHERHLQCDLCGETLTDTASLNKHRSEHESQTLMSDNKRTIACEQCGAPQADGRAYHAHFRREHPGQTRTYYPSKYMRSPLMCELCGKVFADKVHLKMHGYAHTGDHPYKCTTCGKKLTTSNGLRYHVRTHTNERPYKCDVCGKRFSKDNNLKRHKIAHSEAKSFPCHMCGKMFKYLYSVKPHIEFVHMKRPWPKRNRSKEVKLADEKSG